MAPGVAGRMRELAVARSSARRESRSGRGEGGGRGERGRGALRSDAGGLVPLGCCARGGGGTRRFPLLLLPLGCFGGCGVSLGNRAEPAMAGLCLHLIPSWEPGLTQQGLEAAWGGGTEGEEEEEMQAAWWGSPSHLPPSPRSACPTRAAAKMGSPTPSTAYTWSSSLSWSSSSWGW